MFTFLNVLIQRKKILRYWSTSGWALANAAITSHSNRFRPNQSDSRGVAEIESPQAAEGWVSLLAGLRYTFRNLKVGLGDWWLIRDASPVDCVCDDRLMAEQWHMIYESLAIITVSPSSLRRVAIVKKLGKSIESASKLNGNWLGMAAN